MAITNVTEFFNNTIITTSNNKDSVSRKELTEHYKKENGSSKGVNSFIALFKNEIIHSGLKYFWGFKIKKINVQVEPVVVDTISFEQLAITQSTPVISDYEKMTLMLKSQKLQQQNKIEQEKMNQLENLKQLELEMEQKKLMSNEKLELTKLQMEEKKLIAELAMEEKKIISKEKIEMTKLESRKKMHVERIEHEKEENTKLRLCTVMNKNFNEYLDPIIYGTITNQYIEQDSFKKLITYSIDKKTNNTNATPIKNDIYNLIDTMAETKDVIESGVVESKNVVDLYAANKITKLFTKSVDQTIVEIMPSMINNIDEAIKIVTTISENLETYTDNTDLDTFIKKTEKLFNLTKSIMTSDLRVILPTFESKLETELKYSESGMNKSKKDKLFYIRPINNIRNEDNETVIDCYCCNKTIKANNNSMHIMHDIAKSLGGTFSKSNCYLGCADCNLNMKTDSVKNYKIKQMYK
jgi:hypothetical protein